MCFISSHLSKRHDASRGWPLPGPTQIAKKTELEKTISCPTMNNIWNDYMQSRWHMNGPIRVRPNQDGSVYPPHPNQDQPKPIVHRKNIAKGTTDSNNFS